jgi:hypothetical protein
MTFDLDGLEVKALAAGEDDPQATDERQTPGARVRGSPSCCTS